MPPGYTADMDYNSNSEFHHRVDGLMDQYANSQAEQAANLARQEAIDTAAANTQLLQTASMIEQSRQNQLQQLVVLERKLIPATTPPPANSASNSSYYNNAGYNLLTGLIAQALVSGVVNLVNQYQMENARQQQLEQQRQVQLEAEKMHLRAVEDEKRQMQASAKLIAEIITQIKQLADKIPPKDQMNQNFFQSLFGNSSADYTALITKYRGLTESHKDRVGALKFPDVANDSFDDRILTWGNIIDAYNVATNQCNEKYPGLVKPLNGKELFSDREIGRLAFLKGASLNQLSDSQLVSAFDGDQRRISEATLKVARAECRFRKLACKNEESQFWKSAMPIAQSSFMGTTSRISTQPPVKSKKTQVTEEDLKTMDQKSLEKWARSELKSIETDRKQLQKAIQVALQNGRADVHEYEDRVEQLTTKERSIYQTFKEITSREFPQRG